MTQIDKQPTKIRRDYKRLEEMPSKKGLSEELETIINKAWSRGSNWAMKGFGYAMDTDCEKEIELAKKLLSQAIVKAKEEERRQIMREAGAVFVNWDDEALSKKEL